MGGLLWAFGAFALRIACQFVLAKVKGIRFDALDRPLRLQAPMFVPPQTLDDDGDEDHVPVTNGEAPVKGRFF